MNCFSLTDAHSLTLQDILKSQKMYQHLLDME